jgi:hypothetical protein
MKLLILILVSVLVSACGSSGESSSAGGSGGTPTLPPTCKSLYSVWHADTGSTTFDFSSLANGATNSDYEWTASDGSTCGYATNPSQNLSAYITTTTGAYTHQLSMVATIAMTGQCAVYTPPGSSGNLYSNALIDASTCDQITICEPYGSGNCKTFH